MDDTHPYHEAVEITRVPDPTNRSSYVSHTIYQLSFYIYPVKPVRCTYSKDMRNNVLKLA
jgi:hypothetical protein